MQRQGLVEKVVSHREAGGWVTGICGGYQIMGERIEDPEQVESEQGIDGMKLLPVATVFKQRKRLVRVEAESRLPGLVGKPVRGYEIHQGRTEVHGPVSPAFQLKREFKSTCDQPDGAASGVECFGTYIHGLFDNGQFRRSILNVLRKQTGLMPLPPHAYDTSPKDFDQLADWLLDGTKQQMLEDVIGLPLDKPTSARVGGTKT
jgi:cobyric acid synthase